MNIQHGLRYYGAENILGLHFGVHKCRIGLFEAESWPIQEYCIQLSALLLLSSFCHVAVSVLCQILVVPWVSL